MLVMMPTPTENPLREALRETAVPLVGQLLMHAIVGCPEDFAIEAAEGFCETMLVDRLVRLLQERPELLDYLYGDPARG